VSADTRSALTIRSSGSFLNWQRSSRCARHRLKTPLAHSIPNESVKRTLTTLGMAIVFLEGGLSPIPMRWRALNSIVDPVAGSVNSRNVECKVVRIAERNSLPNLDF
jgi:hypothetical protein